MDSRCQVNALIAENDFTSFLATTSAIEIVMLESYVDIGKI